MGDLSLGDRRILESVVSYEGHLESVFEFDMTVPYHLSLGAIASEMGRNPSTVRKRAKKLGIFIERVWMRSSQGTMQETLITNNEGAAALRAWFKVE